MIKTTLIKFGFGCLHPVMKRKTGSYIVYSNIYSPLLVISAAKNPTAQTFFNADFKKI